MLTGDKIDTAKCIAIATGMNTKAESVHEIRGELTTYDTHQMSQSIGEYEKKDRERTMLMIDG